MLSDLSIFSLQFDWIFFGAKHFIPFLANKMHYFWNFVLHNCILVFDPEHVYLKLQLTKFKNKEVTANPKP